MTQFACDSNCQTRGRWPQLKGSSVISQQSTVCLSGAAARQFTSSTAAQRHVKAGEPAGWRRANGGGGDFKDRVWWQILYGGWPVWKHACLAFPLSYLAHLEGDMLKWPGETREESWLAGTRHPSPQEIKVNNQDLTSCLKAHFALIRKVCDCVSEWVSEWVNVCIYD